MQEKPIRSPRGRRRTYVDNECKLLLLRMLQAAIRTFTDDPHSSRDDIGLG